MKHYPGVVPAIVTSLNDPKRQGRIELKFPWLSDSLRERLGARGSAPRRQAARRFLHAGN